jgi:hypothetical protein
MADPLADAGLPSANRRVRTMAAQSRSSQYVGSDFYCDVAIPNVAALDVVHDDERLTQNWCIDS